jgi:hypothetical protein
MEQPCVHYNLCGVRVGTPRTSRRPNLHAHLCRQAGASGDSMGDVSCNKGSTPLHLAAMKVGGVHE